METLHIIMPMAGEGNRFKNAGYTTPKPLIMLNNKPLYRHALDSLSFTKEQLYDIRFKYTFIIRKEFNYINKDIKKDYPNANIIEVEKTTRGALETVMLAHQYIADNDHILVMDCDLEFKCQRYIDEIYNAMLYCERPIVISFYSTDPKYSYTQIKYSSIGDPISYRNNRSAYIMTSTAEKKVISHFAMTGCYYMGNGRIFKECARKLIDDFSSGKIPYKEIYVSLIYNYLIDYIDLYNRVNMYNDDNILLPEVVLMDLYFDKLWSFGTPEDYEDYNINKKCIWDK